MGESLIYAKEHKKEFLDELLAGKKILQTKDALFMAGSPGAGKTEVAESFLSLNPEWLLIDADRYRRRFPNYNGSNSSDFQKGASYLVDYTYTEVLKRGYSFILDGTFAIDKSFQNVERALKRGYGVSVYYVYQDPVIAWDFTKKREKIEGRLVPKKVFINAYFKSRENIISLKKALDSQVSVNIVIKDYQNNISDIQFDVDNIDLFLPATYSREDLEEKLDDYTRRS